MRTKKSLLTTVLAIAVLFSYAGFAQEEENESYGMALIIYMKAKIGKEKQFVKGVKEHNAMYHKDEPYKGYLDLIMSGNDTGWYVWSMGPCTFTDLDNAPGGNDAHDNDWDTKISPNVEEYGRQEYWRYDKKMSYTPTAVNGAYSNVWFIEVKKGEFYRFKALMAKIKEAYEKKGSGNMAVYNNQFSEDDGRDVAIVWEMKNLAEMDDPSRSIKNEYEEINGEGSWTNMIKDWEQITVSIKSQLWQVNLAK